MWIYFLDLKTATNMTGKTHLTAIGRNRRSAPAAQLEEAGLIQGTVLDYGCGRGKDVEFYDNAVGFDLYYCNNPEVLLKKYDTVICTYVANVLDLGERKRLYWMLRKLARGNIYITVRRNIEEDGFTSKGTYQETVFIENETKADLLWENSNYAIYTLGK